MLLAEEGIIAFTEKVKANRFNLNELRIKYNPKPKKDKPPYAKIDVRGVEGIHQEDDYYENLQENIIASNFSWLEPICYSINLPLEATIQVDEDGNFENHAIKIKFDIFIPKEADSVVAFLYNRIKPFIIFNEYVDTVQVLGYYGRITKLSVYITIQANKVSKLLKEKKLNRNILEQWISAISKCEKVNSEKTQFDNCYNIIAGKINMEYKTELVSHYFKLSSSIS